MGTQAISHKCFRTEAKLLEGGKAVCLILCKHEATQLLGSKELYHSETGNQLNFSCEEKCLLGEFSAYAFIFM